MNKEACPFCDEPDENQHLDEVSPGTWALVCQGCGTISPHDPAVKQTPDEAYARWRNRAVAA